MSKTHSGFIYLPESNNKINATLTLGISEAEVRFVYADKISTYITILTGDFIGIGKVTFLNVQRSLYKDTNIGQEQTYKSSYWMVNQHITTHELKINSAKFKFKGLNNWIKVDHFFSETINITELIKNDIVHFTVDLNPDLRFTLISEVARFKEDNYNISIQFDLIVKLDWEAANPPKNILSLYKFADEFSDFISLFSNESYPCNQIGVYSDIGYFKLNRPKMDIQKGHVFLAELKIDYRDIPNELPKLIESWFLNPKLKHCINELNFENVAKDVSRSKKFLTNLAAFEGAYKIVNGFDNPENKNDAPRLWKIIRKTEDFFKKHYPEYVVFSEFKKLQVDARNFYAHGNERDGKPLSEFDLLYSAKYFKNVAKLIILEKFGLSKQVISKEIDKYGTTFRDMMFYNKHLNKNRIYDTDWR